MKQCKNDTHFDMFCIIPYAHFYLLLLLILLLLFKNWKKWLKTFQNFFIEIIKNLSSYFLFLLIYLRQKWAKSPLLLMFFPLFIDNYIFEWKKLFWPLSVFFFYLFQFQFGGETKNDEKVNNFYSKLRQITPLSKK